MGGMSRKASKFYENTNKNPNVDTRMLQRGNVGKEQSICGQCVFFNNPTDEQFYYKTSKNPLALRFVWGITYTFIYYLNTLRVSHS